MRKRITTLLLGCFVLSSIAGCGNTDTESDKGVGTTESTASVVSTDSEETLNIRVVDQLAGGNFFYSLADKEGILEEVFADDNVEFTFYDFTTGADENEAFAAGEADFGVMGAQPAISGVASGYGYHIIGQTTDSEEFTYLIAAPDAGIKSIEDLKGKTIGTTIGGTWYYVLLSWLEQAGLSENDVQILNLNAAEQATSITTGEIDAGVIGLVAGEGLIQSGDAVLVTRDAGFPASNVLIVRDEFAAEYPEYVAKMLEAIAKTDEWAIANPDAFIAFAAETTGQEEAVWQTAYELWNFRVDLDEELTQAISDNIDFSIEKNLLANPDITLEDVLDVTYLEAAGLHNENK